MQWQICKGESFYSCELGLSQLAICQHPAEALEGSLFSPRSPCVQVRALSQPQGLGATHPMGAAFLLIICHQLDQVNPPRKQTNTHINKQVQLFPKGMYRFPATSFPWEPRNSDFCFLQAQKEGEQQCVFSFEEPGAYELQCPTQVPPLPCPVFLLFGKIVERRLGRELQCSVVHLLTMLLVSHSNLIDTESMSHLKDMN